VIARLTSDVEAGTELAADEAFQNRLNSVLRLTGLLAHADAMAFPFIQTDLMKQVGDKNDQRQVLRMLALVYAEAMRRSCGQEAQLLVNNQDVAQLATQSTVQLSAGLDAVLTATGQLESNVGFQADCEQLVLKLLHGAPVVSSN
jgi:DNA polymerase-3 subunit delta'